MADPLPREVKRFINKHLHGFSQLELLLHLHDNPSEPVTAATAARELRLGEEQAAALLQDLHIRGLLATSDSVGRRDSYRYEPSTRELARQVDALAEIYPAYRHRVIQLIFSKPPDSLTNFAEAFRLRKEEDG
ncbi:MAG TPA: hypothetical protein VLA89_09240 [Gemmatimonadales bacterium]|nr:hypothetical protein [Gemmatimonadales bacterium]